MKVGLVVFFFMLFLSLGASDSALANTEGGETAVQTAGNRSESLAQEQGYDIKLKKIEERIDSLKDKIFRSKERLAVLQENVLSGVVSGAAVSIVHKNTVDSLFRLTSAVFYLDDRQIFLKNDAPNELETPEIAIYDEAVEPGAHNISVFYVFEGKKYGFFSYLQNYTFKINAEYPFSIDEGNKVEIVVSPVDRGSEYNFKNRLYIKFDAGRKILDLSDGGSEAASVKE